MSFSLIISFLLSLSSAADVNPSQHLIEEKYNIDKGNGERFDVLVNSEIYDSLETYLTRYASDLSNDGWDVSIYEHNFQSPDSLRSFLRQEHEQNNLQGAELVGEAPFAFYQGMAGGGEDYQEFPTMAFYMDVDGAWRDNFRYDSGLNQLVPGSDGIYDTHLDEEGDRETEIFLGLLWPNLQYFTTLTETELLQDYFDKNHTWRQNQNTGKDTALVYPDDWAVSWSNLMQQQMQQVYSNVVVIDHPDSTTASDYKEIRLPYGYDWIWVAVHSLALRHQFFENSGNDWDYVHSSEIPGINPQTLFYLVTACHAGRFTTPDCLLNHYVFSSDKSLAAISYAARAPAPHGWETFWDTLATGECIGKAYQANVNYWIDYWDENQQMWNPTAVAIVLDGDATAKVKKGPQGIADTGRNLEYKISPNPVIGDNFSILFANSNSAYDLRYISVSIYDVKGSLVREASYNDGRINTGGLPSGVYYVKIEIKEKEIESRIKKIIIIR